MNIRTAILRPVAFTLVLITCIAPIATWSQKKKVSASAKASTAMKAVKPDLEMIDGIVQRAISDKEIPGAVVLIGHNGQVIYRKAFGHRSLEPTVERMTPDTIFDMASLTKCLATGLSVMRMLENGDIRLNDPASNRKSTRLNSSHVSISYAVFC